MDLTDFTVKTLQATSTIQPGEYVLPSVSMNKLSKWFGKISSVSWPEDLYADLIVERSDDNGKTWYVFRRRKLTPKSFHKPFGFNVIAPSMAKSLIRLRVIIGKQVEVSVGGYSK